MEEIHIDDLCCSDCIKYTCRYIYTNKKRYCGCGCHKALEKNASKTGNNKK